MATSWAMWTMTQDLDKMPKTCLINYRGSEATLFALIDWNMAALRRNTNWEEMYVKIAIP